MSKHTPGPWQYDKDLNVIRSFNVPKGLQLHDVDNPILIAQGVELDDARLIAAAPEMLQSLKSARLTMHTAGLPVAHLDRIITKAEG